MAQSFITAFLASLVEFVEALTVILAVGAVRGWRGALAGASAALVLLVALVALLGPALGIVASGPVRGVIGTLLLLFGMRWLRKAILRAAGVIPLHDEVAAYERQSAALRSASAVGGAWDRVAVATAFNVTLVEGIEVVFIVVAVGAGGTGLVLPASLGAASALLLVLLLGFALHRPLSSIPENALKFAVGVMVCGLGSFWAGDGMGLVWPGADWSLAALNAGFLGAALTAVWLCSRGARVAA